MRVVDYNRRSGGKVVPDVMVVAVLTMAVMVLALVAVLIVTVVIPHLVIVVTDTVMRVAVVVECLETRQIAG